MARPISSRAQEILDALEHEAQDRRQSLATDAPPPPRRTWTDAPPEVTPETHRLLELVDEVAMQTEQARLRLDALTQAIDAMAGDLGVSLPAVPADTAAPSRAALSSARELSDAFGRRRPAAAPAVLVEPDPASGERVGRLPPGLAAAVIPPATRDRPLDLPPKSAGIGVVPAVAPTRRPSATPPVDSLTAPLSPAVVPAPELTPESDVASVAMDVEPEPGVTAGQPEPGPRHPPAVEEVIRRRRDRLSGAIRTRLPPSG